MEKEIIDLEKLPFDEAVVLVMKYFGLGEAEARMMVAISQGLIESDIIELPDA